ncbi:MAG: rod shape-determining protein MreC [Deltaproteobacteria bacterium]|nr:rod shape-determining protein MreC [Deltaproteobacteria bacterium]
MRRIKTAWVYVVFVFLALFFLSSSLGRRHSWSPVEQIIVEITAPIQKVLIQTVRNVERLWLNYFHLVDLRKENIRLKQEIDALRMENYRYREQVTTQQRVRDLLQFKNTLDWPVVAAQVIGRDPSGWFESVIIDKGRNSGLKVNMPVVNAGGVVGQTVSVSLNYAKVLLIVDQNSAVDSLIQRSREKGIAKGLPPGMCKLDYVLKTADVVPGDVVVTSGMGGVYPKGLPVGEVQGVRDIPWEFFKDIKVGPRVDFSKLEELLVILKEAPLSKE